eukprot:c4068_g1_i1.p1 GENE.c4068_g1_i1~~c4068_g1_i1.p1  ORF type:complete len:269 (+),score=69.46 c4068_g1_i1:2-808(+)
MYKFLGDRFDEEAYLKIVRNQVLVDIQGQDVLFQIFTSCILQTEPQHEAPFLEFIQRVCFPQTDSNGTVKPLKPGCGGFGIRNFLTLFLSIEVSKAMHDVEEAHAERNHHAEQRALRAVQIFTEQLDESNPILTAISDAMLAEAEALEAADKTTDPVQTAHYQQLASTYREAKERGQRDLQVCSDKYKQLMISLRLSAQQVAVPPHDDGVDTHTDLHHAHHAHHVHHHHHHGDMSGHNGNAPEPSGLPVAAESEGQAMYHIPPSDVAQ